MTTNNSSELHVIFGAGAVGQAIMDELAQRGKRVRVVNRSGLQGAPTGVEVCSGDATDPAFSRRASEGASVVYFALNPPYTQWPELFPRLQAGVLAGAEAAGAKLVAMENVYMYGDPQGKPITEDMPYNAHTRKGRVRAEMTRALVKAHEAGRVRVAMGRASDHFGPRSTDQSILGSRAIWPALAGKAAQMPFGLDMPHTYTPDIGRALVVLGEQDAALGAAWHIPGPETLTTHEVMRMVFEEIGQPGKVQALPKWLLRGLALVMPILREMVEMAYEFEQPFVLDHGKFERAFGHLMQPTPLRQAIQETVQWFRENPAP